MNGYLLVYLDEFRTMKETYVFDYGYSDAEIYRGFRQANAGCKLFLAIEMKYSDYIDIFEGDSIGWFHGDFVQERSLTTKMD